MMKKKEYKVHDYQINMYDSLVPARNDEDPVEERRYIDLLKVTAAGTLYMGLWSAIKLFMDMQERIGDQFKTSIGIYILSLFVSAIIFAIVFVIEMSFRYVIWKGARREAEEGYKNNRYIVCAYFLMAYGVYAVGFFIYQVITSKATGESVVKLFFDVTSFIILYELVISAYKLRKLRAEEK